MALPGRAAAAQEPAPIVITASQIAFYADRGVLIADGGVSIRLPSGTVAATRAAFDLRTNRLVTATPAYAYDLSGKSIARTVSQDVQVPQASLVEATVIAREAEIRPGVSLFFTAAQVRSGGALQSVASFTYAIPQANAKDFGYSPVPAAALEWPVLLASSSNAYSFARVRYDRYNGGPGAGLEEHFARSNRGYVALGQTLDYDGARFDLAAFQRVNDRLTQSLTASQVLGSTYARYAIAGSGKRGFASLSFAQIGGTRSDDLYLSGNQRNIGTIATARLQVDAGHDVHPFDARVAQDVRLTGGVHVDAATLHVGPATLATSADIGETVYGYGRGTLASTLSFWATRAAGAHVSFDAGASFSHNAPPFPSTYRTYVAGLTFQPSRFLGIVSSLTYARDVPQYAGFGRAQFALAFDIRVRRKRDGRGIEIGTILPFGSVGRLRNAAVFNLRLLR